MDFKAARARSNPHAERIAVEGMIHVRRGRPLKGTGTGPTVPRSVRLPVPVWALLEKRAAAQGMTLHAALRRAILEWADTEGWVESLAGVADDFRRPPRKTRPA